MSFGGLQFCFIFPIQQFFFQWTDLLSPITSDSQPATSVNQDMFQNNRGSERWCMLGSDHVCQRKSDVETPVLPNVDINALALPAISACRIIGFVYSNLLASNILFRFIVYNKSTIPLARRTLRASKEQCAYQYADAHMFSQKQIQSNNQPIECAPVAHRNSHAIKRAMSCNIHIKTDSSSATAASTES